MNLYRCRHWWWFWGYWVYMLCNWFKYFGRRDSLFHLLCIPDAVFLLPHQTSLFFIRNIWGLGLKDDKRRRRREVQLIVFPHAHPWLLTYLAAELPNMLIFFFEVLKSIHCRERKARNQKNWRTKYRMYNIWWEGKLCLSFFFFFSKVVFYSKEWMNFLFNIL